MKKKKNNTNRIREIALKRIIVIIILIAVILKEMRRIRIWIICCNHRRIKARKNQRLAKRRRVR